MSLKAVDAFVPSVLNCRAKDLAGTAVLARRHRIQAEALRDVASRLHVG